LVILIISSLSNVGLDLLFIGHFKLGVQGAAYATVLAQAFSGVLCFLYLIIFCPELRVSREDFKIESDLVKELLASGLAMSLMFVIVNIGTVILQSGINGLGTGTIAAHVAARKASEVFMTPVAILSQTISTFASQNYGAGKFDRIKKGLLNVLVIGFTWSVIVILIAYFGGDELIKGITGSDNSKIIALGAKYLRINTPFYFFLIILGTFRNMLQGLGEKMLPIIASNLEMIGKVIAVLAFVKPFGYTAICFTEPITWIICCVPVVYAFLRFFKNNNVKESEA
jgi:Na+-driven multidrug efflux pump